MRAADENDVIQEVWLALHRTIGRGLFVSTSLRKWLKTTTYRIVRDRLKLAYNARELLMEKAEGESEPQDEGPSPEESMQRIDVRQLVAEVLDELPTQLRLVLVMSDADDMSMSEIAEVLEIPVGTGYSRLHVARREFAIAWKKRCADQDPHVAGYGIAPFLLFDAGALFDLEHHVPEVPGGFEDQVWNRLVEALGPGLANGGAGPAAGAIGGAVVAKGAAAGVRLTATQIAFGVAVSALAGAGLYALIAALGAEPSRATIEKDNLPVAVAFSQPSNASLSPLPLSSAMAAMTSPATTASALAEGHSAEKYVLERARVSLGRAAIAPNAHARDLELAAALATLAEHERRFSEPRYAKQREQLRQRILAYQAQNIGHP